MGCEIPVTPSSPAWYGDVSWLLPAEWRLHLLRKLLLFAACPVGFVLGCCLGPRVGLVQTLAEVPGEVSLLGKSPDLAFF